MCFKSNKIQCIYVLLLVVATAVVAGRTHNIQKRSDRCILPPYPKHGTYTVAGDPSAKPGEDPEAAFINVTCTQGYGVSGNNVVACVNGEWSVKMPECVRTCRLSKHQSVEYQCLTLGAEEYRACNEYEPLDTSVRASCQSGYYHTNPLPLMRCHQGYWNYMATCTPECGQVSPRGDALIIGGQLTERSEMPWHVGVYQKNKKPVAQICGGTLVTNTIVISAAHCFWNDVSKQQPASNYAVAIGNLYRLWNDVRDKDAQRSEVKEIRIPARFQGSATNFQEDIAILTLETAVIYNVNIRPVCLDFDISFENRQLQQGKLGKVAGWGFTVNNNTSDVLQVTEMPYLSIEQCIRNAPLEFREYITSDKICAGFTNGTTLCRGDSGGGLVFPESERGTNRYYLRGIVSIAPSSEEICNAKTLATFTQIIKHEAFIKQHL